MINFCHVLSQCKIKLTENKNDNKIFSSRGCEEMSLRNIVIILNYHYSHKNSSMLAAYSWEYKLDNPAQSSSMFYRERKLEDGMLLDKVVKSCESRMVLRCYKMLYLTDLECLIHLSCILNTAILHALLCKSLCLVLW